MSKCADSLVAEQMSFQIEGGGSIPTSALQFYIKTIDNQTAEKWIIKWHYSHRIPTGKNLSYGLFTADKLYACIVYGIGVNPYEASFLKVQSVVEIKRMCRSEPRLAYPLSRFIAISSKMLQKEYPYDCIVAFADPEYGHEGTVYKASGFHLHGMTNSEWHLVERDGTVRHRRFAFRYARRNNVTVKEARDLLNLERIQTQPKYRWVRYLNGR